MYLDLMDVLRAPGNANTKPIAIEPRMIDDLEFVEPIHGEVSAMNARQNIVIRGHATTAVKIECARCLTEYAQPLTLELETVVPSSRFSAYVPNLITIAPEDEEESELSDEEIAALFEGHSLDVLELIRQAAVLQLPRKPLCREDCPGLPEADQYKDVGGDSRWQTLKNWKDNHGSA
jgi:uncharacterized protein